jgi:hypothetical protein
VAIPLFSVPFILDLDLYFQFRDLVLNLVPQHGHHPNSIQEISDKPGTVSALVSIFQNWRDLVLYDAHKYPYKYLPIFNLTPSVVTAC